ncbi:hypothetical protein STEG23_017952 [Scotinomys teguina]
MASGCSWVPAGGLCCKGVWCSWVRCDGVRCSWVLGGDCGSSQAEIDCGFQEGKNQNMDGQPASSRDLSISAINAWLTVRHSPIRQGQSSKNVNMAFCVRGKEQPGEQGGKAFGEHGSAGPPVEELPRLSYSLALLEYIYDDSAQWGGSGHGPGPHHCADSHRSYAIQYLGDLEDGSSLLGLCKQVPNGLGKVPCVQNVADTLLTLELEDCRMKDPDLRVLLPTLSQCSLLTSINLYDNEISTNALKDLLYHTAYLCQLTKELYPAPKEVYNHFGYIIVEEFSQCCAELKDAHTTVRQLRAFRRAVNSLMWEFSNFFMWAFSAMNFPLSTAFIVSHKFWYMVGPFHSVPDFLDILCYDIFGFGVFLDRKSVSSLLEKYSETVESSVQVNLKCSKHLEMTLDF